MDGAALKGSDIKRHLDLLPGIAYCVAIASLSYGTWFFFKPVSSLMWAFVYSIVATNVLPIS